MSDAEKKVKAVNISPEAEIEIASVKLDAHNARNHGRRSIDAIKKSLAEFGQVKPIVLGKDGKVIAGNGTVTAALELGWTKIKAVQTDFEGARALAYALADNRTAELSTWNLEELDYAIGNITMDGKMSGMLDSIGFSAIDLKSVRGAADKAESGSAKLIDIQPQAPPAMSWVLIAVPTTRWSDVSLHVEELAKIPDIRVETVVTSE